MKLKFYAIYVIVFLTLSLHSCTTEKEVAFKVGALLPMTGSGALYGQFAYEGMQLATDEINQNGGINGKKIEIVLEDNQSNAKDGISAFRSLIQKEVPIALTEFSPVVVACSPLANQTKTLLLNCGAQSPKIREGGSYVFSIIIDANVEAKNMAKFLIDSLVIDKVATYVINTETGINTREVFIEEFKNLGGEILTSEVHEQGATDFKSALARIKSTKAQATYLISLVKESAQILKQAYEIGFKTQWLSYASFPGPDIINIAEQSAEGAIYTYPFFDTSSKMSEEFIKLYFEKYSRNPEIYAATFYDGVKLVAEAFKNGKFSGKEIKQHFNEVKFIGVTGLTEFKEGNWVNKPVEFMTVKNGTFTKYKKK
ncbi:MAG: ABC transporter substrate-binding protein [Ignavibacteria bacterium]|jgi:branched-chain amino acid transport system substrate-binding protein